MLWTLEEQIKIFFTEMSHLIWKFQARTTFESDFNDDPAP